MNYEIKGSLIISDLGASDFSVKVKAFGIKFPGFFRHEFELLERTKEEEESNGERKEGRRGTSIFAGGRETRGNSEEKKRREEERRGRRAGGREEERERGRSKDSCYWWLLGGQYASSVALTTRPDRIGPFCERSAAAFSGHLGTRAIALVEKRTRRGSSARAFYVVRRGARAIFRRRMIDHSMSL